MILAARQRILIVVAAAHADQLIDLVVVRRDVLVADGPRDLPAVAFGPVEIEIGVAQRDAAPDVGFAAAAPDAIQVERLAGRRFVRLLFGDRDRTAADAGRRRALSVHCHGFTWVQNLRAAELRRRRPASAH